MKHTPAPWFYRETMRHITDSKVVGKAFTVSPTSERQMDVAHISTKDIDEPLLSKYRYEADEAEANARLIAAAPELLEALEKIAKMDGESFPIAFAKCVDVARAAIAKAKSK